MRLWDFWCIDVDASSHKFSTAVTPIRRKLIWFHYTRCMLIHLDSCYSHVFVDYLWKIWCKIQSSLLCRGIVPWRIGACNAPKPPCSGAGMMPGTAVHSALPWQRMVCFSTCRAAPGNASWDKNSQHRKKTLRIQSEKSWKLGKRKPLLDCGWISRILWTVSTSGNWNWICIILFCSVGQAQKI